MDRLVRDLNVHYEEAGSGRPILILHGKPGDGLTTMPEPGRNREAAAGVTAS
jgi:pimeloyl-ACP methyl ester carboxylesterase